MGERCLGHRSRAEQRHAHGGECGDCECGHQDLRALEAPSPWRGGMEAETETVSLNFSNLRPFPRKLTIRRR